MDRLPPELIYLIVQFLGTPARAAFARCARRYYDILLPHVYTNVIAGCSGYNQPSRIRNPSFFNTILRRPELALAVSSLHLDSWETEPDLDRRTDEEAPDDPEAWDCNLFKRIVRTDPRFAKDPQFWLDGLGLRISDAFFALAVPRFTSLRRLGIEYPEGAEYFNRLTSAGVVDVFPHLEELFISWFDLDDGIDAYRAIPFFSIPSLVKVSGTMVRAGANDHREGTRFSNVTEIDLNNSAVYNGLSEWINLCRELKSFRYMHGGGMATWDDMVPGPFGDTLRPHAASLERLWIAGEELHHRPVDENKVWIGSLADYTALKVLGIPPTTILHMDNIPPGEASGRTLSHVLPRSLKFLCLTHCPEYELEWLPGQLEDLIRVKRCPDLQMLAVETWNTDLWENVLTGVRTLCEEEGIGFTFRPYGDKYVWPWPFYSATGIAAEAYWFSNIEADDG